MADLYQVYGGSHYEDFSNMEEEEKPISKKQRQRQQNVEQQEQPSVSTSQQNTPKDQFYGNGNGNNNANSKESFQNYRRDHTFWDKMSMKRSEVIKLGIFSLVIVLAIAIDRISTHYISRYLSDNILTNFQEFMLRLAYPVVVFLFLWIVKAL
jgi:hypothetical protein